MSKSTIKQIKRTVKDMRGHEQPSTVAKVTAAGVALAGVAAVAAHHYLRDGSRGAARFHVLEDGDSWVITAEGTEEPVSSHPTKQLAVSAARKAANAAAPSDLLIHRADGSVGRSHSYSGA